MNPASNQAQTQPSHTYFIYPQGYATINNMTTKTHVIVGGVAGGASAAARLRRLDAKSNIIVLESSGHVSFANCGLPYHLSGVIAERDDLLLQTPESLWDRFRLDVRVNTTATHINPDSHTITARDNITGETFDLQYDSLVLSPGATAIVPPISGAERGLTLRTVEDLDRVGATVAQAKTAVVVGAGFIGLEAAENLTKAGLDVTVVELAPQVLPVLDPEMSTPLLRAMLDHGIRVELGKSVTEIGSDTVTLSTGETVPADLVLLSVGVRPRTELAVGAGIELGPRGGIQVDEFMRTSVPQIWAVGDAVEQHDLLAGDAQLVPLANLANRQGRRAADDIAGLETKASPAALGTAIVGLFGLAAGTVGVSRRRLEAAGRDYIAIHTHPSSHAGYYPGAATLSLELLVDPANGEILGAQAVGADGVDKRIDVIATAMRAGITAPELADLELAYAPQFGSAKDPINHLGFIAENRLSGLSPAVDALELDDLLTTDANSSGIALIDVRDESEVEKLGTIPGSRVIPLNSLRDHLDELQGQNVIALCAVGQRGHVATRLLRENGINARNLDGGYSTWSAHHFLANHLANQSNDGTETSVDSNATQETTEQSTAHNQQKENAHV